MKSFKKIFPIISIFLAINPLTQAESLKSVLAEKTLTVGFATPEHRGVFRFQVLDNGEVQKVSNKNQIQKLAVLSLDIIKNVKIAIGKISKENTLIKPGTHACYDAPSSRTIVYNALQNPLIIKERVACIDGTSSDQNAKMLATWIDDLNKSLNQFAKDDKNPLVFLDQTEIGSSQELLLDPSLNNPYLECKSFELSPLNVQVSLYKRTPTNKIFELIIKKEGPANSSEKSYAVVDSTPTRVLGSPRVFSSNKVTLSIQGTATPRPDGLLPGTLTEKNLDGTNLNLSKTKLLCKYL